MTGRNKAVEQIRNGVTPSIRHSTFRQMMRPVVQQMAALAERPQIAGAVVARVVVQVGGGKHHAADASVRQAAQHRAMRRTALLASPARALEPHGAADRRPVRRIERTQMRADGHASSLVRIAPPVQASMRIFHHCHD